MDWNTCSNISDDTAGVASIQCIVPLLANIIKAVVALGGVAFFVMLLVGGFNFLFAGGDQKRLQTAQGTITQAIIGLAIMSLAYLIIYTVEVFTGVPVTDFSLPSPAFD